MKQPSNYKWLIIVEGNSDYKILTHYGIDKSCYIFPAGGKSSVCQWRNNAKLIKTIAKDIMRYDFRGIILLVDSDDNSTQAFDSYKRCENLEYIDQNTPKKEKNGEYWYIDSIAGKQKVPIYGITAPIAQNGCMETELLAAYGFPIDGQDEYTQFISIIKQATTHWQIPKDGDGRHWHEKNEKAKLDKFIYTALREGFELVEKKPYMPSEPCAISTIKSIISIATIA